MRLPIGHLSVTMTLSITMLASACSSPRNVIVVERSTINRAQETERLGGAHVRYVQPGDTLYSIAFANGLDVQRLAAWNRLDDTSTIASGRKIRLTEPVGFIYKPKTKVKKVTPVAVGERVKPKSELPASGGSKITGDKANGVYKDDKWRWPTTGKMLNSFNVRAGQHGWDIAGQAGQIIVAARSGEVVYVGNGLKGYGNLIILKHDERFISAYAQNLETFVREGQQINAGERIATMGLLGKQAMLHFQIRVDGNPVDPKAFLLAR